MPVQGRYKKVPRPVTAQEKEFVRLTGNGLSRSKAFKLAFPDHPTVIAHANATGEDKIRLNRSIIELSKSKVQTKHIRNAMLEYNRKMEIFTDKSVDTAIDLVENAQSEKVRADLAIEGIRHRVGTPVQKVQVQQEKNVILQFGSRHPDDIEDIPEGEVVEE